VGPAGAGKSTLAEQVQHDDGRIHVGLSLWGLPRKRLVRGAIALVPTIVISALRKRRLRKREIKQMIRLDALRRVLQRMKSRHPIILLDEGPVFGISWLDLTLAERGAKAPQRWRRRMLKRWGRLLNTVVLLDSSDATLAGRIRTRAKPHRMQGRSQAEIARFADGFRRAFDRVLAELDRTGDLRIEAVRTDGPLNRSAARLRAALQPQRRGDDQ
jgi:hypothetical protein